MSNSTSSHPLITATSHLRETTARLTFAPPVAHVYHPLHYAWAIHQTYLLRYANPRKRVIFLGMNPGPFGMTQTGVPFGEINAVRDWLGLQGPVDRPAQELPQRPILGFNCPRSEVSGRRLWGLFAERFGTAHAFFQDHFVANYCPLVFLTATGANLTPDKLPAAERTPLFALCDTYLRQTQALLHADTVVGVGAFAAQRAALALKGLPVRVVSILHPSPASPAANRGWGPAVTRQLQAAGIW